MSNNSPSQNHSKPAGDEPAGFKNCNDTRLASFDNQTSRVRALNDLFRQSFIGGMVMLTHGANALCDDDKLAVMNKVRNFNAFTPDNDPHEEQDFGSFQHKGETYYWKIDCYDLQMLYHSPDPTNPDITKRVLTIMKAQEY